MRAANALTMTVFAGLGALGLAGCNPGSFSSALDKAPVVAFSSSEASTGSMFVLPLPIPAEPGTASAARMLVSRNDSTYLAVADFDMNGKVKLYEASATERQNLGGAAVFSAAVNGYGVDGTILLGTPRYPGADSPPGRVATLSVKKTAEGGMAFDIQGSIQGGAPLTRIGISVAAGNVTGLPAGNPAGNFVVVGDNNVQVLAADGKTIVASTSCAAVQLASASDLNAFRPVAVGNLMTGGFDEIALGGPGEVVLVQWDGTAVLPCPTKILTLGASGKFGTSLAVEDFDGDGNADLAVGTPFDNVYVYFGPLDTKTVPDVVIHNSIPTAFGQRIAAFRSPGQSSAQLMVGDPSSAADGRAGAGKVMLFNIARPFPALTEANAVVTLFDSNQDAELGVFGSSNLGGLMFNTGLCVPPLGTVQLVPWASNSADVFTFFKYPDSPADPRCFALKP